VFPVVQVALDIESIEVTMPIQVETNNGLAHLHVEGDMTIYTAAECKEALARSLRDCGEIEINLSGVEEMDTAGFQLLLLAKREAERHGKSLRLVEHSPATLEVLDTYDMAAFFGDPVVIPSQAG
jgi:anti-anti-sigma factor